MDPEYNNGDQAQPGPSSIGNSTYAIRRREAQQGLLPNFIDQVATGAAADLYRFYRDEAGAYVQSNSGLWERSGQALIGAAAVTAGMRAGERVDLEPYRAELTEGLPVHLHDDIMSMPSLESAGRRAERYRSNAERDARLAAQTGLDAEAVMFLGSFVDLDLPLVFASGGTVAGVRTAARAQQLARAVGMGPRMARVAADAAVGVTGGAAAGAITGGIEALTTDNTDWSDVAHIVLMNSLAGGALGAAAGQVLPDAFLQRRAAAYNLRRELLEGTQNADPRFTSNVDYAALPDNPVQVTPRQGPVVIDLEDAAKSMDNPDSLSAAAVATPSRGPTISMNMGDMTPSQRDLSTRMHQWRYDSGFDLDKAQELSEYWVKVAVGADDSVVGSAVGRMLNLATSDWAAVYRSQSPTANYVASEIFESASGVGRMTSTAAVHNESFLAMQSRYTAETIPSALRKWKHDNGYGIFNLEGDTKFNREVLLEMQARADGRTTSPHAAVKEAADAIDSAMEVSANLLRGRKVDEAVEGAENLQHYKGYVPYMWDGKKMIEAARVHGEAAVKKALAAGYINRGTFLSATDAEKVANALYKRFTDRARGVDAADARVMDIDNRSSIEAALVHSGLPEAEVKRLMDGLTASASERTKQGNLKSRNDIDLNTRVNGSTTALVDLMSDNLQVQLAMYQRRVAGSAALARKGIRSKADRTTMIETIMREQEALGEPVLDRGRLEAMFSVFDGGPRQGYLAGSKNDGVDPYTGMMQRATRASLLQQLGLTQFMDFANAVAMNGVRRTLDPVLDTITQRSTKAELNTFLDELESVGVIIGQDHHLFQPHLNLDDVRNQDSNLFLRYGQPFMGQVERMTGYASGFYHITSLQQKAAAAGITHNLMKRVAEVQGHLTAKGHSKEGMADRIIRDFGIDAEDVEEIFDLIQKGVIEVDGRYVKLNSNQWSDKLRENFGAGVLRSVSQQVQKGLAGESSVWMSNSFASLVMQLKTFGLLALQKQLVRNVRVQRKQAYIPALWQLGFGYSVLTVRDAINDKQRDPTERARLAAVYNPMLGGVAMAIDPVSSMLGFDDFNVSPYGNYASFFSMPAAETIPKLINAPGAVRKWATGEEDWQDKQNMRALFFMNLYGMQRILD